MTKFITPLLILVSIIAFFFSVSSSPPAILADCYGIQWSQTSPSLPTCLFPYYICENAANLIEDCCDTAAECPTGTYPMENTSVVDDPTEIFCGEIGYINTAIGCIPASDPQKMISLIATWALSIAAGAGFITIAYAGFLITTAQGDVKKINDAKTFLISALLGLLTISLAMVLLNFIGVRILGIENFGFKLGP